MPSILMLQLLNLLMGGGSYLVAMTSFGVLTAAHWSAVETGAVMMFANLAYAGLVGMGGRLADHFGRARTAISGASLASLGAMIAVVGQSAWASVVGLVVCFAGTALFFPGNAGLFSDARSSAGAEVPLHVKVSRYNLGWSGGNVVGFGMAWVLAHGAIERGFLWALGSFILIALIMIRWWSLPAQSPSASSDRADHPALKRLIRMGRVGLLGYCLAGMALIALLENAVAHSLNPVDSHRTATAALAAYALGYFSGFMVLGLWSGWVMRPWRLFILSLGMLVAALGVIICGQFGLISITPLATCCLILGLAFAAIYTASLYYSLRLPHGAAGAAGLHETFLGIGSTIGPPACGLFISGWTNAVTGMGVYLALGAILVIGWQLSQLPQITRLLRAHPP